MLYNLNCKSEGILTVQKISNNINSKHNLKKKNCIIDNSFPKSRPIPTLMAEAELDFSKPWPGSDVTFLIENKKIYANKLILSMWSPVMETMFTSDFKEKDTAEIPLPGKNYEDFLELMKAVHPPNKQITGTFFISQQR